MIKENRNIIYKICKQRMKKILLFAPQFHMKKRIKKIIFLLVK